MLVVRKSVAMEAIVAIAGMVASVVVVAVVTVVGAVASNFRVRAVEKHGGGD